MKDPKGARRDVNKHLELQPGDPRAYMTRGEIRKGFGQLPSAKRDFQKAAELFAKDNRTKEEQKARRLANSI